MKNRNIKLSFCEVLGDLISKSGKTLTDIAKDTDLAPASLSLWRDGKSDICSVNLCVLAEYFHVSTDFLLGLSKSQYRVDDLPENKKNLEYFISYTGLSKDSVERLHGIQDDFTLTTLLDFLLTRTDVLDVIRRCFFIEDNESVSSLGTLIENIALERNNYKEFINKNPELSDYIRKINILKSMEPSYIKFEIEKALNVPNNSMSFNELMSAFSDVCVIPAPDSEYEIYLLYRLCFYAECYKYTIGRKIIDDALKLPDSSLREDIVIERFEKLLHRND